MDVRTYAEKISFYNKLTKEEQNTVLENVSLKTYKKGEMIHSCTGSCLGLIYVIEGDIRVSIISEEGREITLYRLSKGDTCVISAACVLHEIRFESGMTATSDTTLLILNSKALARLMASNPEVKSYSYEIATRRFSAALFVLQEIIFARMDTRLARFLLEQADDAGEIRMTQEKIAESINSAREVVARMLRQFVIDDLVELKRGLIVIKDEEGLEDLL
ncbi:MAG: Crp/Fnr family transcriptional regulator [Lachnospiraceae bacterium]|nr:Crp/Fnr family transcriptional regulator [Lachnospiraceae bacterium]